MPAANESEVAQESMLSIIENDEVLSHTVWNIGQQCCITLVTTAIGGMLWGRLGAALGGVLGAAAGYGHTDEYKSGITALKCMNPEQRDKLRVQATGQLEQLRRRRTSSQRQREEDK